MSAVLPWLTRACAEYGLPATREWWPADGKPRHAESIRSQAAVFATAVVAVDDPRALGVRPGDDAFMPASATADGKVRGPYPWRHPVGS